MKRRDLLRGALFLAAGGAGAAAHYATSPVRRRRPRTLVHVELRGGNDGLNTVVPLRSDAYRRARPSLAFLPHETHEIDPEFGLHPNLEELLPLWRSGRMSVVHAVGVPHSDRSHFHNRRVWAAGSTVDERRNGWLGRVARSDRSRGRGAPICVSVEPLAAVVHPEHPTCVLRDLGDLRTDPRLLADPAHPALRSLLGGEYAAALDLAQRWRRRAARESPSSGSLADRMQSIAGLIEAGHDASVYAAVLDGFDTHATQEYRHALLLEDLAHAVRRFFDRLEAGGLASDVLVVASSEFGRRVAQNGSEGTDHGLAGPVFAFGDAVAPGLHGAPPDLADLDDGDLRPQVDFRCVLSETIESLGFDAGDVLGDAPPSRRVGFLA